MAKWVNGWMGWRALILTAVAGPIVGGCGDSQERQENVASTFQALGETSTLTFSITHVQVGDVSVAPLVDKTLGMATSWDTTSGLQGLEFFECGPLAGTGVPCVTGAVSVIPDDFLDSLHLRNNPQIFSRTKVVSLDAPTASIDVQMEPSPCGQGQTFISCNVDFSVNVDLTTGAYEPEFHSGILGRTGNCLALESGWHVCYKMDVPCTREIVGNGTNEDCDTQVDECDLGTTTICSATINTPGCVGQNFPGIAQCEATGAGPCVPLIADSVPEVGNQLDDDCDGKVDECNPLQPSMQCTTPPGSACPGRPGTALCSAGQPGACVPNGIDTIVEQLNGLDDDCDGTIDECNPGQTAMPCAVPFKGCTQPQPGEAACSGPTARMCLPFGLNDPGACPLPGCAGFPDGDNNGNGSGDDDGDGLRDCWEAAQNLEGVPLPGANPLRKNLYVELDYMEMHKPAPEAIKAVIDAFRRSPVTNPDGTTGIDLHVIVDESLPHDDLIHPGFCLWGALCEGVEFDDLRDQHFGQPSDSVVARETKKWIYRYGIFAHLMEGHGRSSGLGENPGDDFIVSLGDGDHGCTSGGCVDNQAGTFMHELGHTLGLNHGGGEDDDVNYKPNYVSVMNYTYQLDNQHVNGRRLDYSRGLLPDLNEFALSEASGLGPNALGFAQRIAFGPNPFVQARAAGPINWNRNKLEFPGVGLVDLIDAIAVVADVNGDLAFQNELDDHNDWTHLQYDITGSANSIAGVHTNVVIDVPFADDTRSRDTDGDGVRDTDDNCVFAANSSQVDRNGDFVGDACEIAPSAECLDHLGGGVRRAMFGYQNARRGGVRIPPGDQNRFASSPVDRGQVRDFMHGRWKNAFEVEFSGASLTWLLGGHPATASATSGLPACNADPDGDGIRTADDNCPFVSNTNQSDIDGNGSGDLCWADDVLSFEDASRWAVLTGSAILDVAFPHTQGAGSLAVTGANFIELGSVPLDTRQIRSRFPLGNPTRMRYDVFIPNPPPNVHWLGATQAYVTCPSAGIHHQYIGQIELTGLTVGGWNTITLTLPANVRAALAADRTDFAIDISLYAPSVQQTFRFDNLRFGP